MRQLHNVLFQVVSLLTMLFGLCAANVVAAELSFQRQVIDPEIGKVCYAVTSADVNGDGKLDVVAISENRVLWYENPTWKKHVILENQTEKDNVCIAAHDIDGDGAIDFALGAGWTKVGTIQWISRKKSPEELWSVHYIATELSTHRMSFADVLGSGKPQLVVSPLNRSSAPGARMLLFEIPNNPASERWAMTVADASNDKVHNHTHRPAGKGQTLICAGEHGVFEIVRGGDSFSSQLLVRGAEPVLSEDPKKRVQGGAGEVRLGATSEGRPLLATMEPMHGTAAVAYVQSADRSWSRHVLVDDLKQGHAIWVANVDGQPGDEVIVGHREPGTGGIKGPGLSVFQRADASKWVRHVLDDGGMATEDALAVDLNGDGLPEVVGGGRSTHNVVIYWNNTKHKRE